MQFDEYQENAASTAIYPERVRLTYPILGLANEAGEVAGKLKKFMRDEVWSGLPEDLTAEQREKLIDELGDVLWYAAATASDLGVSLDAVAEQNLIKLFSRQERGVLTGSGDNR